jgi:hypothetical protein
MPQICACDVVSSDVVATRGYSTGGAASLLTVGRSTLASRAVLGTLGDGATPTLGRGGIVGDGRGHNGTEIADCCSQGDDIVRRGGDGAIERAEHIARHQDGNILGGDGWRGAMAGI